LADRTAGNPFFVEQVLLHLRERGQLTAAGGGLALAVGGRSVPPSVGAVVVARLDGLPRDLRRVVRCASVLGARADVDELRGVLVREPAPVPDVDELTAGATELGLWRRSNGTVEFAHALVRDAAYDTLLLATRRRLHAAAAAVIEERNAGNLGPHLHRLALHHAAAGALDRSRACERAAADRALGLGAYHEAGEYAESGLATGSAADGEELGLWLALAASRMVTEGQGAPSTKDAYDHAAALAGEAAETRAGFRALFGLRTFFLFTGDHRRSLEMAERSLEIAERIGAADVLQQAHLMVGNAQFWVGELESSERHLRLVLEPTAATGHDTHRAAFVQNPRFTAVFPAALGRWLRGDPAGAWQLAQDALDEAVDAFSVATVLQVVGFLHCLDGNAERALETARRLVETARENAYPVYVGIGSVQLGWAQARLGAVEDGLALMLDTQARMRAGGTRVGSTLMAALAADAHLAADGPDRGLALAEEALADAVDRRELAFAGLLLRLRDDLRRAKAAAALTTPDIPGREHIG
jgi:tetratricopeptide (TPR) repeat protein